MSSVLCNFNPTPNPNPDPTNEGLSTGAIIGIVAGGVVLVGGIGLAIYYFKVIKNSVKIHDDMMLMLKLKNVRLNEILKMHFLNNKEECIGIFTKLLKTHMELHFAY
jgi:hypothetical protein